MIPTYAELRRAVSEAAVALDHPTKPNYKDRKGEDLGPHRYGRIVYFEGGHVGIATGDGRKRRYLIAKGGDHQDSILALAQYLGIAAGSITCEIDLCSPGHFWLRCAAGK